MNNSIQNLSLGKPDSNGYQKHKNSDAGEELLSTIISFINEHLFFKVVREKLP